MSVSTASRFPAALAGFTAPARDVDRVRGRALVAFVVGAFALAAGWFVSPDYFFRSYLVAWLFWTGVAGGSLALSLLHQMSAGRWGMVLRRPFEAASRTLPWMLLLAVPVILGANHLYSWTDPAWVAQHPATQWKVTNYHYLVFKWWALRLVVWMGILCLIAWRQWRLEGEHDRTGEPGLMPRMRKWAGPSLVVYCLVITFAAVDWLMSLEPDWSSTMYGFYLIISQALSAMAFGILVVLFLSSRAPMSRAYGRLHFHDYGKLLFAMIMMWTYFCFSQYLIIWAGNLPDEIFWFKHRITHGWGWVAMAIVVFHFALPFVILLSRDIKRNVRTLSILAGLLFFMRLVDIFWQVEPSYPGRQNVANYWMFLAAPLGIGGLWVWLFLGELKKRPLVPIHDPRVLEAIGVDDIH
jgi:hypothetical protein